MELAHSLTYKVSVLFVIFFNFPSCSLISKLMLLSQAVRVLLHMRRPGVFEEEF